MYSPEIAPLVAQALTLQYDHQTIIDGLDLQIPAGQITVFVGSNGSGKSTLLKAFARLLTPANGRVLLHGTDIHRMSTSAVARTLAILPQTPLAPDGISVRQLVAMGRYPHQNWLRQWSPDDENKVMQALLATDTLALQDRAVETLSGGQRQRVWIAMTLAQNTDILLLDEPTTYLDLAHQIEVLDLLCDLNRLQGKTIVMVLHDLNLACRYADHLVAVHQRGLYAQGEPAAIFNAQLVKTVFNLESRVVTDPVFGTPLCIPLGRHVPLSEQRCHD